MRSRPETFHRTPSFHHINVNMGREESISRTEMRDSSVIRKTETDADIQNKPRVHAGAIYGEKRAVGRLVKLRFLSDQCHFDSDAQINDLKCFCRFCRAWVCYLLCEMCMCVHAYYHTQNVHCI